MDCEDSSEEITIGFEGGCVRVFALEVPADSDLCRILSAQEELISALLSVKFGSFCNLRGLSKARLFLYKPGFQIKQGRRSAI